MHKNIWAIPRRRFLPDLGHPLGGLGGPWGGPSGVPWGPWVSLGRPVGVPEGRPLVTESLFNDAPQRSFGCPHRRYNLGSLIAYVCSDLCATRRPTNYDSHGCLANYKHVSDCVLVFTRQHVSS